MPARFWLTCERGKAIGTTWNGSGTTAERSEAGRSQNRWRPEPATAASGPHFDPKQHAPRSHSFASPGHFRPGEAFLFLGSVRSDHAQGNSGGNINLVL